MTSAVPLLEARGLIKRYGHVIALRDGSLSVNPGEIVALIGDNGAGKSTMVKILSGSIRPDGGELLVEGKPVSFGSPADALDVGIATVFQDLALAPDLDPSGNLYLGRERLRKGSPRWVGMLDKHSMRRHSDEVLKNLGVSIKDSADLVANLSGGQKQSIAVAKAVTWADKLVILDEPTAALGVLQTRKVHELIHRIRNERGIAIILISHSMPDVLEVADRVEVLRLGRRVARFDAKSASMADLVGAMTGAVRQEIA